MLLSDSLNPRLSQLIDATVTGLPALGAGFTISVNGNDAIGQINIETGSNPEPCDLLHVTFKVPYAEADVQPFVFVQPIDQAPITNYHTTIDWFGWDLITATALKPNTNYALAYFIATRPWAMYLSGAGS